mmetsp:Transcript_44797/g.81108  ORF Transcript_44797/g.81108 Transcript_44797/m.81108 type:complete len:513 (-) Transcript_44797:211-1749(-)
MSSVSRGSDAWSAVSDVANSWTSWLNPIVYGCSSEGGTPVGIVPLPVVGARLGICLGDIEQIPVEFEGRDEGTPESSEPDMTRVFGGLKVDQGVCQPVLPDQSKMQGPRAANVTSIRDQRPASPAKESKPAVKKASRRSTSTESSRSAIKERSSIRRQPSIESLASSSKVASSTTSFEDGRQSSTFSQRSTEAGSPMSFQAPEQPQLSSKQRRPALPRLVEVSPVNKNKAIGETPTLKKSSSLASLASTGTTGGASSSSSYFTSPITSPTASFEELPSIGNRGALTGLLGSLRGKVAAFDAPNTAVILFDWDDTLCPTNWASNKTKSASPSLDSLQMEQLHTHVRTFEQTLREARKVARVAVITLAAPDWFHESAARLFPGLNIEALFRELGIKVYFAAKPSCDTWHESERLRTLAKKKAMAKCLATMYPLLGSRGVKWNVLSVGDSTCEQQALKALLGDSSSSLCKTVKFSADPDLDQLTNQLRTLIPYLQGMISHSKDFDRSSATMWVTG